MESEPLAGTLRFHNAEPVRAWTDDEIRNLNTALRGAGRIGSIPGFIFQVLSGDLRTANHTCEQCGAPFVAGSYAYQTLDAKISSHIECLSAVYRDEKVEQSYDDDLAQIRATGSLFRD
jgi:hypothetical protein